ncbi:MAG: antibiotic biosynthesis monooxygenase [Dehalococcoidia bacterium]
MFIAMNRFQVVTGKEEDFERIWRERESYLEGTPGFVRFALLKSEMAAGEYVSHSTWQDRESFMGWMNSEAFAKGHRQGSLAGILQGPPMPSMFEVVIQEEAGG